VIADGCTDGTVDAALEVAEKDPRIRVFAPSRRLGKASAVNLFLRHAEGEIRVVLGADLVLAGDALAKLTAPFEDPGVGMTGGRPIPLNPQVGLINRVVHLQWRLHHRLALRRPKLGEIIALRNSVAELDEGSCVDEACLEQLHAARGLRLVYVPDAVAYNHGPTGVRDFFEQRRRIHCGHAELERRTGYRVSTRSLGDILSALTEELKQHPELLFSVVPVAVCLEGAARLLGLMDLKKGRSHKVWRKIESSKRRLDVSSRGLSD
jgi:biofilm PGA synthesis N-glycosyltransferase PgaC